MRKVTKWAEGKLVALVLMTGLGLMSTLMAAPSNLQQVFNDAKADYDAENYEKAAVGFRKVLKYQPSYVYARKYLTQTEALLKKGKTVVTLESKLSQLEVPSVEFDNASLGTVMSYLSQKAAEVSGGKVVANFIYKGPREDKESKMVTLKLGNVPMTEVIRYVGQLTGTKFKYEEYAVVGIPALSAAREEASARALLEKSAVESAKPKFDDQVKDPFAN